MTVNRTTMCIKSETMRGAHCIEEKRSGVETQVSGHATFKEKHGN